MGIRQAYFSAGPLSSKVGVVLELKATDPLWASDHMFELKNSTQKKLQTIQFVMTKTQTCPFFSALSYIELTLTPNI